MTAQDILSNNYFKDKNRFADLLNGFFCEGKQIIQAKDIRERDPVLSRTWNGGESPRAGSTITDVLYQVTPGLQTMLVSLQNQTDMSLIMPVRVINTDAFCYYRQWKTAQKEHKKNRDLKSGEEYLSGISREDRLIPVLSVIVYYGRKPWNAPVSLKDLLDASLLPENIQKSIADYPVNLLDVRRYPYLERFRTDIRQVFGFLQNDNDKEHLKNYVAQHREVFSNLADDAYDLLCVMSRVEILKQYKQKCSTPKGGYNMCKAIDDMITDSRNEGIKSGENRVNALFSKLKADNRIDDLLRSVSDREYQNALFLEYGL